MYDLETLEQEIRENCGEEYLNTLRRAARKKRIWWFLNRVCAVIAGVIIFIILILIVVLPAFVLTISILKYNNLAEQPVVEATCLDVSFEGIPTVKYEFFQDDQTFTGSSDLHKEDALSLMSQKTLPIFVDSSYPKFNRAVLERHPVYGFTFIFVLWGFILLVVIVKLFYSPEKRPESSDLPWLEYITTSREPSPRAWLQYCLTHPMGLSIPWSYTENVFLDNHVDRRSKYRYVFLEDWKSENDTEANKSQLYLRTKYAIRYLEQNYEQGAVPCIKTPEKLNHVEWEEDLGDGYSLLEELANNGSVQDPETIAFEIDLSEFSLDDVYQKKFRRKKTFLKYLGNPFFRVEEKLTKISQVISEEEGDVDAEPYLLRKIPADDQQQGEAGRLSDVGVLSLQENLLYCFYTTPWCRTAFSRVLPFERKDGYQVNLRLDYEPGKCLKVTREPASELIERNDRIRPVCEFFTGPIKHQCDVDGVTIEFEYVDSPDGNLLKVYLPDPGFKQVVKDAKERNFSEKDLFYLRQIGLYLTKAPEISDLKLKLSKLMDFIYRPLMIRSHYLGELSIYSVSLFKIDYPFAEWFFDDEKRRQVVRELFQSGAKVIRFSSGKWELTFEKNISTREEVAVFCSQFVDKLSPLYIQDSDKYLELLRKGITSKRRSQIWYGVKLLLVLSFLYCSISGFVASGYLIDSGALVTGVFAVGFFVYLYIGTFSWYIMDKFHWFAQLFLLVLGIVIAALLGGVVRKVNISYDYSKGEQLSVPIVRKEMSTSKNSHTHYFVLSSWTEKGGEQTVTVDKEMYEQTDIEKQNLEVSIHPGRLGFDWFMVEGVVEKGAGND